MGIINMRYHLPEQYERDAEDPFYGHVEDDKDWTEDFDEVEEVKGAHCTAACQHASKVECVCGCGGRNHGVKSIVKLDAFFSAVKEEEEEEEIVS